jgi:formylmethanofuran dehydrogenase subunit B
VKADDYLNVSSERGAALLAVLRACLNGLTLDRNRVLETTGIPLSQIATLADRFQAAKYGAILFGQSKPDSSFDLATDSLSSLIRDLNNATRFVGIKLRTDANAQSAEDVLSWSSGYPLAVSHNQGLPRFHWHEYSAETILHRKECDAVLFATGPDLQTAIGGLSRSSREFMGSIPTIALSPIANFPSSVAIQIGLPGLDSPGEFCRFDGVWLPLKDSSKDSSNPGHQSLDATDVLAALRKKLQA